MHKAVAMDCFKALDSAWVIAFFLLVTAATCLAVNKSQRNALVKDVRLRGRKKSTAKTPPQSISPEKSATGSLSIFVDVLPPPRREALTKIEGKRSRTAAQEVNEKEIREHILPMTADYRTAEADRYTPTGFSVQEIKELGDFPDYATLSGVPLPNPYHEFDIDKARPRPYRPFRWAYHQTMCTWTYLSIAIRNALCVSA